MTPGERASCLGTSSPHALSQRLLEYSRSKDFKQVLTGLSGRFQRYPKVTQNCLPAYHSLLPAFRAATARKRYHERTVLQEIRLGHSAGGPSAQTRHAEPTIPGANIEHTLAAQTRPFTPSMRVPSGSSKLCHHPLL
jgi:hypothetical protein